MHTEAAIEYRFGPFVVTPASGELLRNDVKIRLQEQPFHLLLMLLESPGQIVTRDDLRSRLWQEDTFVDFDGSLRVAVRKLREALNDDAENPRYIETVPKRGYRFIAGGLETTARELPDKAAPPPLAATTRPSPFAWITSRPLLATAAFALTVIAVTASVLLLSKQKSLTAKDTVVLAEFANSTGDPVFDGTLRQGLAVQLEQSPFLSLTSDRRIQQMLTLMGKPADTRLTPDIAREVCERISSAAVFDGSIGKLGDRYVLGLRARDCRNGETLAEQQTEVAGKDDVLKTLGQMSSKLRAQVGESLSTVQQHNTPLAEAATSSLEALKAYSTGIKVLYSLGDGAAIPFFKTATQIDPQFAIAYAQLGLTYGSIGETALATQSTMKAYELRNRASDTEKYFITATYELFVTGNMERARENCETWARAYPREPVPHAYLSGGILPTFGSYEESGAEALKAIELDPQFSIGYTLLAFSYISRDRYTDAENSLHRAKDLGLKTFFFSAQEYGLAFLRGDTERLNQPLTSFEPNAASDDLLLIHQAFALAYTGHIDAANAILQHAADLAQQTSRRETAALYQAGEAVWEAFAGDLPHSKKSAYAALQLSNQRDVEYGAAFALALSGDYERSKTLADDLEQRFPEDTSVRFSYLPELRALAAIKNGNAAKAIELLQAGASYNLGMQGSSGHIPFGAMYAVYTRGQAYMALHRGTEAAAEFRKILTHRGIVVSDPVGALARLQLARAYAMAGEPTKARAAYQDFLALWKDADQTLPVLVQAKAEYVRIH